MNKKIPYNSEYRKIQYQKHREKILKKQKEYAKNLPKKFSLIERIEILEDFIRKNKLQNFYKIDYFISEEEIKILRAKIKREFPKIKKERRIKKTNN
jgi:hypothetical protein